MKTDKTYPCPVRDKCEAAKNQAEWLCGGDGRHAKRSGWWRWCRHWPANVHARIGTSFTNHQEQPR